MTKLRHVGGVPEGHLVPFTSGAHQQPKVPMPEFDFYDWA
jgi:hypothetical protein